MMIKAISNKMKQVAFVFILGIVVGNTRKILFLYVLPGREKVKF